MRILGILFYATVIILAGLILISFSLAISFKKDLIQPQYINNLIVYAQESISARFIIGLSGLLLILISFAFARLIFARISREKTIPFVTAQGEVTISHSAVEDLIKRTGEFIAGIKELKPDVINTKKGIIVDLRVILKSEVNIQELTAQLQEAVMSKIQEVLGFEKKTIINVHVAKISFEEKKKKEAEKPEHAIPFGGYGKI